MAKGKESCPDCAHNAQVAQEANDRAATLQANNERLTGELAKVSEHRGFDSLAEMVSHCESGKCSSHSEEWNKVKEKIVAAAYDQIPAEVLLAKAQERGFMPKRLVIGGIG